MADPETLLGNLNARERRAWQQVQQAERDGVTPSDQVKDLRREAQGVSDQKRNLWRDTYEEGRTLERKR